MSGFVDPAATWTLLLVLVAALVVGVPVAFAVGIAATAALLFSVALEPTLITVAQRMATGLDSFALLAIPLFILSGQLMNRGGAAQRLVELGRALVGGSRGGLLYVNVVACLLFGAISGSAVAAAAAIGAFMLPLATRDGLPRDLAAAVNITSSTTGLLIPPSNVLIVYSLASGGVSIAALFVAGYFPGLLVGALLLLVAARMAPEANATSSTAAAPNLGRAFRRAAPSLLLIFVVMGGIVIGAFTATEAAGIATLYALLLVTVIYREVKLSELKQIALESASTTGVVLLLISSSMALSWTLAYGNVPQAIASALLSTFSNELVLLAAINLLLLAVGTFMDMTPAILIFVPILLPIAEGLGLHPVHFGMVMVLNLCVGLCTPPVGTVLFVGLGVAKLPLRAVLRRLMPFYLAMTLALALVTALPEISLYLPRLFGFL